MDHDLVLENSSSAAFYTLPNTIIYLKAVKYLKPAFRFTKRCLVYDWGTKSASVKTTKISAAQRGSEHDNTMNERRRQPSTGQQKKKTKTKKKQADSNYFYTKESIPSMKFHARVTSFACTLRTLS